MAITPNAAHPYGPTSATRLAGHFDLDLQQVQEFLDQGMPGSLERCDPFLCYNWLCRQRLDAVPALARRWRTFTKWFQPHLQGERESRRVTWQRQHALYLPQAVSNLRWAIPQIAASSHQVVEKNDTPLAILADHASASGLVPVGTWRRQNAAWRLDQQQATPGLQMRQELQLVVHSQTVLSPDDAEHTTLLHLLEPLVAGFRYGYRQHQLDDRLPAAQARYPDGSCLDCALLAQGLLRDRGWNSRLVAGVLAHSAIANPHYWLEVQCDAGWAPVDVSMAAMARMLGEDWRAWLSAWVGSCDARRVRIGHTDGSFIGLHECQYVSCAPGAVAVAGADGCWQSAWNCIDWVCGLCSDQFRSECV